MVEEVLSSLRAGDLVLVVWEKETGDSYGVYSWGIYLGRGKTFLELGNAYSPNFQDWEIQRILLKAIRDIQVIIVDALESIPSEGEKIEGYSRCDC